MRKPFCRHLHPMDKHTSLFFHTINDREMNFIQFKVGKNIFHWKRNLLFQKKTFWNVLKSFYPSLIKNFFPFKVKTNPIKFHLHKHILPHCMPIKMATCLGLGNTNWGVGSVQLTSSFGSFLMLKIFSI